VAIGGLALAAGCIHQAPVATAAPGRIVCATQPNDTSLFQPPWTWESDTGKSLRLADLGDRPMLIAMFFTSCSGVCGVTVSHMQQINASLTAEQRRHTRFVLVTFDSENDTPRVLARYRAEHQLPSDWILLRGSPQSTRELADALTVKFRSDPARHILHGSQITLVDDRGRIVERAAGVNADLNSVVELLP
jgi:protein SCO1/2